MVSFEAIVSKCSTTTTFLVCYQHKMKYFFQFRWMFYTIKGLQGYITEVFMNDVKINFRRDFDQMQQDW